MAKKKINKGLEAARQKLTADFLESSGVPKGRDRTKLIKEIKQHADTGGMSCLKHTKSSYKLERRNSCKTT